MKNEMELSASLADLPASSWQGMGAERPLCRVWVGAGWVMATARPGALGAVLCLGTARTGPGSLHGSSGVLLLPLPGAGYVWYGHDK